MPETWRLWAFPHKLFNPFPAKLSPLREGPPVPCGLSTVHRKGPGSLLRSSLTPYSSKPSIASIQINHWGPYHFPERRSQQLRLPLLLILQRKRPLLQMRISAPGMLVLEFLRGLPWMSRVPSTCPLLIPWWVVVGRGCWAENQSSTCVQNLSFTDQHPFFLTNCKPLSCVEALMLPARWWPTSKCHTTSVESGHLLMMLSTVWFLHLILRQPFFFLWKDKLWPPKVELENAFLRHTVQL